MSLRHLILDRDGVLNREAPDQGYITEPSDWVWERGALAGLRALAEAGVRLSVVTNQSVIGRGGATRAQIDRVNEQMRTEASAVGVHFAALRLCPHAPDAGCGCRKPAPALVTALIEISGVPVSETVMVGDASRDLQAGVAAGVRVVLVRTGKGRATEAQGLSDGVRVFDDLWALAQALLAAID